jgi:hypothetical protein
MKQFFTLALTAGTLMVTSPGHARMVASKSQCVASCGDAINTTCGWITKPGRFNRCRTRLIKQCRKFGTDVMCPAPQPPPPPAPVVTTTTTTTLPYVPPTTTLPAPLNVQGEWDIYATLVNDPCGLSAENPLIATGYVSQNGISLSGAYQAVIGPITLSGGLTGPNSFSLESETLCLGPCCSDLIVTMSNITGAPGFETGDVCVGFLGVCSDGTICPVQWGAC